MIFRYKLQCRVDPKKYPNLALHDTWQDSFALPCITERGARLRAKRWKSASSGILEYRVVKR